MARHAAKVLTDIDALLAATARTDQQVAEEIRLGIFPSLATHVLPRLLGGSAWHGLGLQLKVFVAEPAQTIQGLRPGGELDVALVFQVGQGGLAWPHTLDRQWIGEDSFRVVLPRRWGIRDGAVMTAEQLAEMPWIMHHPGTSDATVIGRLFAACNLHPQVSAYCDDFNASLGMAGGGLGAALVPQLAMLTQPADVVVVDVPEVRLARSIFALIPREKKNSRTELFMDELGRIVQDLTHQRRPSA
jgi:DNA-binding transcriptional LysR family regulator